MVATNLAFFGFEAWRDLPGVAIADEPTLFWHLTVRQLSYPGPRTAPKGPDRRDELRWSSCLAPMIAAVEALAAAER